MVLMQSTSTLTKMDSHWKTIGKHRLFTEHWLFSLAISLTVHFSLLHFAPMSHVSFSFTITALILCHRISISPLSPFSIPVCPPGSRVVVTEEDAGFRARCCRRMALRIQGKENILQSSLVAFLREIWHCGLDYYDMRECGPFQRV